MTRKDFVLIAEAINATGRSASISVSGVRLVAERMADALATTNARFDRARFITACLKGL